ncbi:hypothetical protein BGZ80_000198 [Entomortierella chlamydospora]|uniref:RRM domain-containing protein n=1 Tax=Entomortierella chlamydospora TaxID=101097 RepID=A0A9P6SYR2_9FUNG|nr:hypothetical protein BGZ80_000198 [Entomortierella chlamydospora]
MALIMPLPPKACLPTVRVMVFPHMNIIMAAVDLLPLIVDRIVIDLTLLPLAIADLLLLVGTGTLAGMIVTWGTMDMIEVTTGAMTGLIVDMIVVTVVVMIADMTVAMTATMTAVMAMVDVDMVTVLARPLDVQELLTEEDRLASKTLYVGNIPYSFREPEVEDMFKKFGTIVKITVVLDQFTGRNKGFAFVEYEDRKDAEEAMEKYNGFDVEGRRLKLDWDIGLNKKDIKPRSAGTTTENSTAEASPQPQTQTATEASAPVESETSNLTVIEENKSHEEQQDDKKSKEQSEEQDSKDQPSSGHPVIEHQEHQADQSSESSVPVPTEGSAEAPAAL